MQANIIISKPDKTLSGTIQLTGSKSECNRALIIEALSKGKVKVSNMSDAADAVTLKNILHIANSELPVLKTIVTTTGRSNDGDITSVKTREIPQSEIIR